MPLVVVALAVALLILLMTKTKLNGFLALLTVAALVGVWAAAAGVLTAVVWRGCRPSPSSWRRGSAGRCRPRSS